MEGEEEWSLHRDYAYFAVKLGWSKREYLQMTRTERMFVRKQIEADTVSQSELIVSAIETAISNTHQKRGRKRRRLWRKRRQERKEPPMSAGMLEKVRGAFRAQFRKGKEGQDA